MNQRIVLRVIKKKNAEKQEQKYGKLPPVEKKWREGVVECKIPETVLERNKK